MDSEDGATLSSPLIINHQSVLNVHLQLPVSSVSERQVCDRAFLLELANKGGHRPPLQWGSAVQMSFETETSYINAGNKIVSYHFTKSTGQGDKIATV